MLFGAMGGIDAVIMFMAGLFVTLYAVRRIGKKPGVDLLYDQRFARIRPVFLFGGPLLMIGALVLPLLESSPPPPPPPQDWQTVTTSDGVCRVEMPGTPTLDEDTLILKGLGEPQAQQLKLIQEGGAVRYILSRDLQDVPLDRPAEKLLDGVRDNRLLVAKRMSEAKLVRERNLSEQGCPGREWVIDMDDKRQQSRWFLVHKRLYRAIVSTPRDDKHLADAGRFLESFRIVEKPNVDKGS
jgi:hypothetical protein